MCTILAVSAAVALAAAETFGAGVTLKETTSLDRVISSPAALEGKTVKVEGVVTSVCTHMGCWMALAVKDAPNVKTLLVKVDDGVIVFPVTAKGKRAAAQGVIERVANDAEGQAAAQEHAKAEKRESAGTTWQLKATGAIVY
jgi:hypothetical protein